MKLFVMIGYFISSLFSLIFTGRLATVSPYRLMDDPYISNYFQIFKNVYKKENSIGYVSEELKRRIINDFIYDIKYSEIEKINKSDIKQYLKELNNK